MSHKRYRTEKTCLNCGAEVEEHFCSRCGQENLELHDNFFHMAVHVVVDYFHFDSKFFRTLIPLFTKPGFLTREYWRGRRASYVPPVRLFIFVTIVFMIVTGIFYNRYGDRLRRELVKPTFTFGGYDSAAIFSMPDTLQVAMLTGAKTMTTGKELKERYAQEFLEVDKLHASVDFFFSSLKYVTFLLLPVYALYFKLLYFRRRTYYIDQVIYTMHLQAFVYIIFCVIFLLSLLIPRLYELASLLILLVLFLYLMISLHRLYRQQWWKTLLKSMLAMFALVMTTVSTISAWVLIDTFWIKK